MAVALKPKPNYPNGKPPEEPRPKKARQVRSTMKVFLTVFFDCNCVVYHAFLPQGRTVNKEYYHEVMRRLSEKIRQKRTELWKNQSWICRHVYAPAHTLMLLRKFLAKKETVIMSQPPYSIDFTASDFFRIWRKSIEIEISALNPDINIPGRKIAQFKWFVE